MGAFNHVQGMRKTEPIETRIARLFKGSHEVGDRSMASIPSAAAERKIAPIFVVSTTPLITMIRLACRQIYYKSGNRGRCMAHRTPRVKVT